MNRLIACVSGCALLLGCNGGGGAPAATDGGAVTLPRPLTRAQLLDPNSCKDCHPNHYREWSSSMHAYAAQDPVFLAMNKRGQRETGGELGDFCVKCHAPMAVLEKKTTDGLNLDELPEQLKGVTCYFCHNAVSVDGDHNAMLTLANDTTMRGGIRNPLQPGVHRAASSDLFNDRLPQSSAMCGACHDIVTNKGVHLERTFEEYRSSLFAKPDAPGALPAFDTCPGCHMQGRKGLAAIKPKGVGLRTVHEHLWPGVDVPLTDFPNRDALHRAIEDCQLGPASVAFFTLEVTPFNEFQFLIETNAGHNQPSGAAQDRRMWLEFMPFDADGKLIEPLASGNIADGEVEDKPADDPKFDKHLLMLRDRIYDENGKPVHMFWEAAPSADHPKGYESNALPVATTSPVAGTHSYKKTHLAAGVSRVTARLRMRPMGLDVLQDLVDSGDLDQAIVSQMPTFTFPAQIEWTPQDGFMKPVSANPTADCATYKCMLDPGSTHCKN